MSWVKVLGAAFVVASCTAMGFHVASSYRLRPIQLSEVARGLRLLQAEIEYTATPLPMALRRVSDQLNPPVRGVFAAAAEKMKERDNSPKLAFTYGVQHGSAQSVLKTQDWSSLLHLSETLGSTDIIHQSREFQAALLHMESMHMQAVDGQQRYERLWQYLGALTGLFVVLMLY
ncbi:hypothetical protein D2Q93_08605 [Alicyclobacillaceae bacterium I2511]|nr:hypothetical protein D2Q93_08605 [Alicyclobacillaceae bacterium I2511]